MMRGDGAGAIVARAVPPATSAPLVVGAGLFVMKRGGVMGSRLAMSLFTLAMAGFVVLVGFFVAIRARGADDDAREVFTRLQALLDHVLAGLSLRGLDGRYLSVNDDAAAILGRSV